MEPLPPAGPVPDPGTSAALDRSIASLTDAQRRAVLFPGPTLSIHAGAGSGKTRVLTIRLAHQVATGTADPDHAMMCTFTRRAADELRSRLDALGVPVASAAPGGGVRGPGARTGTLHQLALSLVRRQALDDGRRPPRVSDRRLPVLCSLVGGEVAPAVDAEIGWAKARCLLPDTYADAARAAGRWLPLPAEQVAEAFAVYQTTLGRRGVIDLDDVIPRAADLIEEHAPFAAATRWRYRHLFVDEFQDINPAQFRLVEALLAGRGELTVVGDPDQAIYGWNGADPDLLLRLPQLVPGLEVLRLDHNHRSSARVVEVARYALGDDAHGVPVTKSDPGPRPTLIAYGNATAEAAGVAATLLRWSTEGIEWGEQAVLARTNEQLVTVAAALRGAGVPYRLAADAPPGRRRVSDATALVESPNGAVELASFHRAKGLEWLAVSIIGLEDGLVPLAHTSSPAARAEERRLLYVALTRARRHLACSWARTRPAGERTSPRTLSPWLGTAASLFDAGNSEAKPPDRTARFAALRARLAAPSDEVSPPTSR